MTTMREHGLPLLQNGYEPIPIIMGEKRPSIDEWQLIDINEPLVRKWSTNGTGNHGVGIRCGAVGAIDVDVLNKEFNREMLNEVKRIVGNDVMVRIGRFPKFLVLFRHDRERGKARSRVYKDTDGNRAMVEVMGRGQQIVAYGIHPDTKEPFKWHQGSPDMVSADSLPVVTEEQIKEIIATFETLASRQTGWRLEAGSVSTMPNGDLSAPDNAEAAGLITLGKRRGLTAGQINRMLEKINPDDYDTWVRTGMAIYHESMGADWGLDVWDAWSSGSGKYPGQGEVEKKWHSFALAGASGTVTMGTVSHMAAKIDREEERRHFISLEIQVSSCTDPYALIDEVLPMIGKDSNLSNAGREALAVLIKKKHKDLTGYVPRGAVVDRGVRPSGDVIADGLTKRYSWASEKYVYIEHHNKFYDRLTRQMVSREAIKARYNWVFSQDEPEKWSACRSADAYMLEWLGVKTVWGALYMPGMEDEFFEFNGRKVVNLWNPKSAPRDISRGDITETGWEAIRTVENHAYHLFGKGSVEANWLLDFISYIVRNPGKRIRHALVMHGGQGDGKTFWCELLAAVIGQENVNLLDSSIIQGNFTSWADRGMVKFVEEIYVRGHNRFEIMNKFKHFITNSVIPVHYKGIDPYDIPNTASYILTTNHGDALALEDNDRRYAMFRTLWVGKDIAQWTRDNPHYFERLYGSLLDGAGALRWWLTTREMSPDFSPFDAPPMTRAKAEAISMSRSDAEVALDEALENEDQPFITYDWVSATALADYLNSGLYGHQLRVNTSALNKLLTKRDYHRQEKRVRNESRLHTIYKKDDVPEIANM